MATRPGLMRGAGRGSGTPREVRGLYLPCTLLDRSPFADSVVSHMP